MSASIDINLTGGVRKWKRYPAYKPVLLDWLQQVPEHWPILRLKDSIRKSVNGVWGDEPNGGEDDIVCIRVADFDRVSFRVPDIEFTRRAIPQHQRASRTIVKGDLLLEKSGGGEGQPVGAVVLFCLDVPAVCSNFIARIQLNPGFDPSFICYLHASLYSGRINVRSIKQSIGIQNLDAGSYFNEVVPYAPLDEQRRIVTFLDRETAKIDTLIAKKERLIELLQEQRIALISHAVTKGIDPTVPMKDSGVEWLGKIPAHWGVIQSRRVFKVRNEPALESDEQLTASQKYGMLPQTEFMEREGRRVVVTIKGVDSLHHVEPNDYVISLRSFQGGIEWCKLAGSVTFHYVVLKPVKTIHPPYFGQLFKSSVFIQALRSTTDFIRDGQDLRYSQFVLVPLPVVPMDEQAAIASFLDRETHRLDRLIAKVGEAIDKLREYRTALISAAVTGKIDVREEVA